MIFSTFPEIGLRIFALSHCIVKSYYLSIMLYLRDLQKIIVFVGILSLCCFCSEEEEEKLHQVIPFKSIHVHVDNETVEARRIDNKNISLSFENAENFSEAQLSIELTPGYEVIFPQDVTKADLTTYPVVNFRAPDNKIIKYWFVITSKAFPILDATKISIEGIGTGNVSVQNSTKEVIIDFDKTRMDMSHIQLHFQEGSLMDGAKVDDGNLIYDFTQGLSQDIVIQYGGSDRHYKVVLNLARAMDDPKKYGFTDVSEQYVTPSQYPFVSVLHATTIMNVPVKNSAPETPWSWDVPSNQMDEYLAFIGDWKPNRPLETVNDISFTVVTIDIEKAKAKLVSNNQREIAVKDVPGFIVMSGLSSKDATKLFYNGKVLNDKTSDDAPWRSAVGFSAQGEISFYNASILNNSMVKLPFNTEFPPEGFLYTGTPWNVVSAACGRPWLVRNGHLMTREEMYRNDGTGWEIGLGEAWNGEWRSRSFIGTTYDNKLGCAVLSHGLSIPQAAWLLNKMGWKDVFFVGGSYWMDNEFQTTLCIDGKLVDGNKDQVSQYCIVIDLKN